MKKQYLAITLLSAAIAITPAQAGIFDIIKDAAIREAKDVAVDKAGEATGINMSCARYTGSVDVMSQCMQYSLANAVTRDFGNMLRGGDAAQQESAVLSTIFTGQPKSWNNSETGTSGESKVVKEKTKTKKKKVAVLKDKVDTVPELDLVGENYRASSSTNVRSGPGTDYKIVGSLQNGDVVNVVGKVTDQDWYLVSQGGVATGYVFANLLTNAANQDATIVGTPEGEVAEVKTKAKQTCKTIEQTVTTEDGTSKTKKIKACQTPNGWEIV
ncbi:MAG: SH3 domain-containing protein [Pseudomonadota bacterium]